VKKKENEKMKSIENRLYYTTMLLRRRNNVQMTSF